jgi:hypothetical protein
MEGQYRRLNGVLKYGEELCSWPPPSTHDSPFSYTFIPLTTKIWDNLYGLIKKLASADKRIYRSQDLSIIINTTTNCTFLHRLDGKRRLI